MGVHFWREHRHLNFYGHVTPHAKTEHHNADRDLCCPAGFERFPGALAQAGDRHYWAVRNGKWQQDADATGEMLGLRSCGPFDPT